MATPSERINLIKAIAARLSEEKWPLIDLTLSQFSLPTSDFWNGDDRSAYIIAMVSSAPSESLIGLAAHLGVVEATGRPGIDPDFWEPGHFRLFISHLATQKSYATHLQAQLKQFQISAFVAHKDITPTRGWQDEIELALTTADALVALLNDGFHASHWTDQEVGFVMGRGLLTVAARLGEEPYGFIGKLQAFEGEGKPQTVLATEMFEAFVKNKLTRSAMARALVTRFEQSNSFAEARGNVGLLEQIDHWEGAFQERIERAVVQNEQVRHSTNVPRRAGELIKKWVPQWTPPISEVTSQAEDSIYEDIPFE